MPQQSQKPLEKNGAFRNFYFSLTGQKAFEIREQILTECEISYQVFYNWVSGRSKIKEPKRSKIAQVVGRAQNQLFPICEDEPAFYENALR